jgi:hypothetical protein
MFRRFGATTPSLFGMEEKTLLSDDGYAARTYRVGELMAMWMVQVGILQFYDADGNMLATVNLLKDLTPQRAAA